MQINGNKITLLKTQVDNPIVNNRKLILKNVHDPNMDEELKNLPKLRGIRPKSEAPLRPIRNQFKSTNMINQNNNKQIDFESTQVSNNNNLLTETSKYQNYQNSIQPNNQNQNQNNNQEFYQVKQNSKLDSLQLKIKSRRSMPSDNNKENYPYHSVTKDRDMMNPNYDPTNTNDNYDNYQNPETEEKSNFHLPSINKNATNFYQSDNEDIDSNERQIKLTQARLRVKLQKERQLKQESLAEKENKQKDEDKNKNFKLRCQIENGNGFHALWRPQIKHVEWAEHYENDALFCNQIHIQKCHSNNIKDKMPTNKEATIEWQNTKREKMLEMAEKSSKSGVKKFAKHFSNEITKMDECKQQWQIQAHVEKNSEITSKDNLHQNLMRQQKENNIDLKKCLLPLTFHTGSENPAHDEWEDFEQQYHSCQNKLWIIKPTFCNKGNGIKVCSSIEEVAKETRHNGKKWIVQKYIEKPLLIKNRKFDIRIQGLITTLHGRMRAYFFKHCQVRTNSQEYSTDNLKDPLIHLSNDAVQIKDKDYGKYEDHNKMSISDFERDILLPKSKKPKFFWEECWPKMQEEFRRLMLSVKDKVDPERRHHGFEVLGFDYMLDDDLNLYLIEINNNPALGLHGVKVLENAITPMSRDVWNLTVNSLFFGQQPDRPNKNYEKVYDDQNDRDHQ